MSQVDHVVPLRKGYDKAALSDREAELGDLLKPDPPPGIPGWAWEIQASPSKRKWGKYNSDSTSLDRRELMNARGGCTASTQVTVRQATSVVCAQAAG